MREKIGKLRCSKCGSEHRMPTGPIWCEYKEGTEVCEGEELKSLKVLVNELKSTNSSNAKKEILARYPDCKPLLWYVLNPFINFYITSNNLKKRSDLLMKEGSDTPSLKELLDLLTSRKVTGHNAIKLANTFINDNSEYEDILHGIIDKNLETRVDAKLANKVWPGFIPEFEVVLAKNYKDYEDKISFEDDWYASRKLDGVRCIAVVDENGKVDFFSRKGKDFYTLDVIREAIEEIGFKNIVLDGEICIVDEDGNEDFSSIMKEIRKKDHTILNPRYKIFDLIPKEDFEKKYSELSLSERYEDIFKTIEKNNFINVVPQWKISSKEDVAKLMGKASTLGWEGLILRKDVPYEGKRTKDMLKVKSFHDGEYRVKDVLMEEIRYFDSNGDECKDEMLSAIIIEHRGYEVKVGSGFSIVDRIYYHKNPSQLIGKEVTVVYFEETTNKQGTVSLRFPTVKTIHKEKEGRVV
jgi:DNA ligase-1